MDNSTGNTPSVRNTLFWKSAAMFLVPKLLDLISIEEESASDEADLAEDNCRPDEHFIAILDKRKPGSMHS